MRRLTNIIVVISTLLSFYYIYLHFSPFDISKILLGIVSILLLIIPYAFEKIRNKKIEEYIKLIYYFFLLVSFILGGLFQLYYSTTFFDLFVHAIFGILLSIILCTKIKNNSFKNFIILLSLVTFVGFLWECLEFLSDILIGTDHQEKISGASDTMTDMLISMVGGLIYTVYFNVMNKIKK